MIRKRRAPAWLWPALISVTLALGLFFLVMIIVPGLSDSYISGPEPQTGEQTVSEPLVTRPELTEQTEMPTLPTEKETIAVTEPEVTIAATTMPTDKRDPVPAGSPATLLIRRAVERAEPSILTLYVAMPERAGQPGRTAMFSGIVIGPDNSFVTPTSNFSFALTYDGRLHDEALAYAYVTAEDQPFRFEMIAHDRNTDVALLRLIDAPPLAPLSPAVEPRLELGDLLVVLGGSEDDMRDLSLSVGYLTGVERRSFFENGMANGMLQTSAFVTPIMSGAALLDPAGQLVGLINSNVSKNYSDLHGYALPADVLADVVRVLSEPEPPSLVRRVWLGIRTMDESEYAALADLRDYPEGLMVTEVLENGPAASSDLMRHDVIVSVDGQPVASLEQLNRVLEKRLVGERVMISLYRTDTGRYLTTYVYLREAES